MKTIILVEDDQEIARLASMFLESEGFNVLHLDHGNKAIDFILNTSSDLIILDIMLPGKNGIEICREVRPFYRGPILMLTACEDDINEISALNRGADDYLTKPIRPHVLLAHINALLRRDISTVDNKGILFSAGLKIDMGRREVSFEEILIDISSAEFDLIALLAKHAGDIVDRNACYQALRGIEYDGIDRAIDMRVASIRKKLLLAGFNGTVLKTVRGKGYMLLLD